MDTQVEYALACQKAGLVPICEPEVLINGNHSIEQSYEVTSNVLKTLFFTKAKNRGIYLPGAILKTSMVIYGKEYDGKRSVNEVAKMTIKCLKETVPEYLGAVVFLSGGQTDLEAVQHLNLINQMIRSGQVEVPWPIRFSYSRAIQNAAMQIWNGKSDNILIAQAAILERATACAYASKGVLNPDAIYSNICCKTKKLTN